ncbi:MAG: hypothetical protein DMG07_28855 [Acidobacteria bacterium]|nr:MAG: hypothetical protein DMG07_28855 [Acidobacteriota bacterium]
MTGHLLSLITVAGLSGVRATPASVAALGGAAVVAALTRGVASQGGPAEIARWAGLLSAGAVLLWQARRRRQSMPARGEPRWRLLAFAAATLGSWLMVALPSANLLMLHRLASEVPAAAVFPGALAAILWSSTPARRRLAALASGLALLPLVVAAPIFKYRVIRDPFVARMPAFLDATLTLAPLQSTRAPDNASSLRLSPGGTRFLVAIDEDGDTRLDNSRFVLGDFTGKRRTVTALGAEFIADDRVLVLSRANEGVLLGLYGAGEQGAPLWERELKMPGAAQLSVDVESRRWRITSRRGAVLFRADGLMSEAGTVKEWPLPRDRMSDQWLAGDGDTALGVGTERRYHRIDWWPFLYAAGIDHIPFWPSRFSASDPSGIHYLGRTLQDCECVGAPPGEPLVCLLSDGRTTGIWRVQGSRFEPVGEVAGKLTVAARTPPGGIVGWVDGQDVLLDLERRRVLRLSPDLGSRCSASDWRDTGAVLGALVNQNGSEVVMTFGHQP